MSPCDSAVFSEGYLSTTIDRQDIKKRRDSSEFRVRLISNSSDYKEHQTSSEKKSWQTGMYRITSVTS